MARVFGDLAVPLVWAVVQARVPALVVGPAREADQASEAALGAVQAPEPALVAASAVDQGQEAAPVADQAPEAAPVGALVPEPEDQVLRRSASESPESKSLPNPADGWLPQRCFAPVCSPHRPRFC